MTTRRRRAEPITRLRDGRYRAVTDGPRPEGGRRSQLRRTFTTRDEARDWLAKIRLGVRDGSLAPSSPDTVSAYLLGEWLPGRVGDLRPGTISNYRHALAPVVKRFGDRPLQGLTKRDLDTMKAERLQKVSARSVNLTLTVLGAALADAVKDRRVSHNVAALVKRPRVVKVEMRSWSNGDLAAFRTAAAGDDLAAGWALTGHGLRRGEVLGLRWSSVDLDGDAPTLTIRETVVMIDGHAHDGEPKSAKSWRTLSLVGSPDLVTMLRTERRRQAEGRLRFGPAYNSAGRVVVDATGEAPSPDRYSDRFADLVAEHGLPPIRLHDVRHSTVSKMLRAGVPPHIVARWHGHDIATMHATYAHVVPDDLATAGAALAL